MPQSSPLFSTKLYPGFLQEIPHLFLHGFYQDPGFMVRDLDKKDLDIGGDFKVIFVGLQMEGAYIGDGTDVF